MDSKEFQWAWVTADRKLCEGPCELLYAYALVSATSTDTYLYNNDNGSGDVVARLGATVLGAGTERAVIPPAEFRPGELVYLEKGLFVDIGTNVLGVFIQWRKVQR